MGACLQEICPKGLPALLTIAALGTQIEGGVRGGVDAVPGAIDAVKRIAERNQGKNGNKGGVCRNAVVEAFEGGHDSASGTETGVLMMIGVKCLQIVSLRRLVVLPPNEGCLAPGSQPLRTNKIRAGRRNQYSGVRLPTFSQAVGLQP